MVLGGILGSLLGKLFDKAFPDRSKNIEAQTRINEAELSGAPTSILRLWRSFLGWVLAITFTWEVVGRLMVIPVFFPDVVNKLPKSQLEQIITLLLGMLGLGW